MNRATFGARLLLALSLSATSCASKEPPTVAAPRSEEAPPTATSAAPAAPAPPAASAAPSAQAGPIDPASVSISLGDAGVVVNGTRLEGPTVADVKRLFGEPDRVDEKVNRIHVFDRHGIIAYEAYDGLVSELQIYFAPEDYPFIPKTMFRGHIDFAGQPVDKTTPVPSLRGLDHDADVGWWKYKGPKFSLLVSPAEGSARREPGRISVSFPKRAGPGPASHPREAECKAGSADACVAVMNTYMNRSSDEDAAKANRFAKLACDGGQAVACLQLGANLQEGKGGAPSPADAKRAFARACKLGLNMACPLAK
jgi:hypothetical protein